MSEKNEKLKISFQYLLFEKDKNDRKYIQQLYKK